jgi:phosphoenolpyruvate-protein phosphotransferase/dihydroxyacetone kinase phosphotransfer subunit
MIGLVIVSHSYSLAQGVVELVRQIGGADLPVAAAGGLDLPDHPIGTDAALIQAAIDSVYSPSGVLVLMDMGSAILSAEMALEMMPADRRERVVLSPAPLVEGAVTAAVQIKLGQPLEQIVQELQGALQPKQAHFTTTASEAEASPPDEQAHPAEQSLRLMVVNPLGLHARPAARIVQTAGSFQAKVQLRNVTTRSPRVSAASLNSVATLGVRQGHEVEFTAVGDQAAEALAAIQRLADDHFGDPIDEPAPPPPAPPTEAIMIDGRLQGLAASAGIAIGPARRLQRPVLTVRPHTISDPDAEIARFYDCVARARADIINSQRLTAQKTSAQNAMIFEVHTLLLEDESLLQPTEDAIRTRNSDAASAWQDAVEDMVSRYQALEDPFMRARAADVKDVGLRVLGHLLNVDTGVNLTSAGVLIAEDLSPSETANLDTSLVQGICTAAGSPTSHSAILARALGIPAVVGLGRALLEVPPDTLLIVDGSQGLVYLQPSDDTLAKYQQQQAEDQRQREIARQYSQQLAYTKDGYRVEVFANVGSIQEAHHAVELGAEGIGLLRTEFLFLNRADAPSEDEQYAAFCAIGDALAGRPMIIRTLDVGGDKPLAYVQQPVEANPFLGQRAIRLSLAQPDLFKTQLRAVIRASLRYPLLLMFPMIAVVEEFQKAVELLDACRAELNIYEPRFPVGMMVEVPSAAIDAAAFAPYVDFFSIGTNDLTQYIFAAERGNAHVSYLANDHHPVILRLIRQVVETAQQYGRWVEVCGELAGDLDAVETLVNIGVRKLSMSASRIPAIKQTISQITCADSDA